MVTPRRSGAWQRRASNNNPEDGFVLPTVLGVGLILLVSSLALGYSAYQANLGGIQNLQAAQAEANAETGAAQVFNALNNEYFFLARASSTLWPEIYSNYYNAMNPTNILEKCTGFTLPSNPQLDTNNPLNLTSDFNTWKLIDYTTDPGNAIATLVVQGRSGSAQTNVRYTYTLKSSNADGSIGFPGLLAKSISLGNNDVLGTPIIGGTSCSGNILCTDCTNANQVNKLKNSIVNGVISVGKIEWPLVPEIPNPANPTNGTSIDISTSIELPQKDNQGQVKDALSSDGNYHYKINDLKLTGNKSITVNTPNCDGIDSQGSSCHKVILHISGCTTTNPQCALSFEHNGDPEDFVVYGNQVGGQRQYLTLNGNDKGSRLFLYMPTATLGINGGANGNSTSIPDFYGAVWVDTWDKSSSNQAEIVVPADMYKRVKELNLSPIPSLDYRLQSSSSWKRGQ